MVLRGLFEQWFDILDGAHWGDTLRLMVNFGAQQPRKTRPAAKTERPEVLSSFSWSALSE
jgi:hypothetical protein